MKGSLTHTLVSGLQGQLPWSFSPSEKLWPGKCYRWCPWTLSATRRAAKFDGGGTFNQQNWVIEIEKKEKKNFMIIPNSLRKARNEWVEHWRRKNIDFCAYYTPIYLSNSSSNAIRLAKFHSIISKVICFIGICSYASTSWHMYLY